MKPNSPARLGLLRINGRLPVLLSMAALLLIHAAPVFAVDTGEESAADSAITAEVKLSLLSNLSLNFHVQTSDGVVTLSGIAETNAEKLSNMKLASEIKGVKGVINAMVISLIAAANN